MYHHYPLPIYMLGCTRRLLSPVVDLRERNVVTFALRLDDIWDWPFSPDIRVMRSHDMHAASFVVKLCIQR